MKIERLKMAALLPSVAFCLVMSLAACSNDDIVDNTPKHEGQGISFSLVEEDFEPGEEVGTRAAAPQKPEIVDLGDGLTAEVSLEPDTTKHTKEEAAKTRAMSTYGNHHYTIRAYQGSTLKGEIKGSFSGSTFTPDAGDDGIMYLPHGNYDFVCFNDKVSASGTTLTFNRADARESYYTVKRNVTINQDPRQEVAFSMKPAGSYAQVLFHFINFQIPAHITGGHGYPIMYDVTPDNPSNNIAAKWESGSAGIKDTWTYDFVSNTNTYTTGVVSQPAMQISYIDHNYYSSSTQLYVTSNNVLDNTVSFLPTTDLADFKITFTAGEILGHSLVGKSIPVRTHLSDTGGKRYMVNFRLKMAPMYLFSDGTTGTLAANPGKTAVGVVINAQERIAMALNDFTDAAGHTFQWGYDSSTSGGMTPAEKVTDLGGSQSGTNNTLNSTVAGYSSAVGYPTSGTNQWYIPSFSEWASMIYTLGCPHITGNFYSYSNTDDNTQRAVKLTLRDYFLPASAGGVTPPTFPGSAPIGANADMSRLATAFTAAGGTAPNGYYWLTDNVKGNFGGTDKAGILGGVSGYFVENAAMSQMRQIRPVIKY